VDNGFTTEAGRLLQYLCIESKPTVAGAARPFAFHGAKADFLRPNTNAFRPGQHFRLEDLGGNYLFKRFG